MKKVFISQPMNGKTQEEILKERERAVGDLRCRYGEEVEVLDSYFEDYNPDSGCIPLKYLAKSLEILADADAAYFIGGWKDARGCRIENRCAQEYGIEIIDAEEQAVSMKFAIALDAMKAGAKVKRPTWAGYWEWDPEAETIRMHCRPEESDNGNPVLDIRETQRVEYTLKNILSEDWMIANNENCPKLGGKVKGLSFGEAIRMAKLYGAKISREGWNGKGQYVELATGISYKNAEGDVINVQHDAIGNAAFTFVGTSGVQIGWLASQADMLADDWGIVE